MKFRRTPDNDDAAAASAPVEWIESSAPAQAAPSAPVAPAAPTAPPVFNPSSQFSAETSTGGLPSRSGSHPVSPPVPPGRFGQPQQPPMVARGSMLPPTPPPSQFGAPAERIVPEPDPVPSGPGWGWRALVAFVAGGVIAGGSFAAANYSERDTDTASPTVAAAPASVPGPVSPPIVVEPPDLDTSEPAAFVASLLGPSVVQIEIPNFGLGSGVVYGDGLIITNQHVVGEATEVDVRTSDGRVLAGEVLGGDERTDIAVVSVGSGSGLPAAQLAVGDELQVGQATIAIGSPFQLQQTVTSGIISAVNRPIFNGVGLNAMIQTDAAINPGNSGGALSDRNGRVIGINTSIQTDGTGNSNIGVGFAVPIDTAVNIAERIVAGEPMTAGFLGVSGAPTTTGDAGINVTDVTAGSAAERAGLQIGDRVVKLDGAPVTAIEELAGLVQTRFPGDEVDIELVRDGETIIVTAVLGER